MIGHTKAYERFKHQGSELLDFCVLQSFALPCLAKQIRGHTGPVAGTLPPSTYIKNDNITAEELSHRIGLAGNLIGKELLLSTFSYFEAYVIDAFKEILDFHGGAEQLLGKSARHIACRDTSISDKSSESRRKLREYAKPGHAEKYKKHARILYAEGYPMPSQRLSAYGWQKLSEAVTGLKAKSIPDLLVIALGFPLSQADRGKYQMLRDKRNKIAHGRLTKYPVKTAVNHGTFFRDLAIKIDRHIVEQFLMIEHAPDEL